MDISNNNLSNIKEYVSHFSAARLWNVPYLDMFLDAEHNNSCQNCRVSDSTVTAPELRYQKKNRIVHMRRTPLPRGAVVKRGDDLVSSPELMFLDLAKELSLQKLILLGLQLCSHSPNIPTKAITTKRKIKEFLKKASGFEGHVKAERAIAYIKNGSNSIMESLVFMMLTLPYRFGGFGLSGADLNHEITLDSAAQRQLGQKRCYVDIFYPEANIAVEYDSSEYHDNPGKTKSNTYDEDMLRSNTIKSQGIDVLHLTKLQLYREKTCEQFVQNLASRLGKRIRKNGHKDFDSAHQSLRLLLP